jgi:hypothetical protein
MNITFALLFEELYYISYLMFQMTNLPFGHFLFK